MSEPAAQSGTKPSNSSINSLVSVLMVNYNYGRFLGAAIESVLAQTYPNFELIICDDGSRDNSRAVIEQYASTDPRVRYIFKKNERVAAALNDAYKVSTGDFICLLDADDLFDRRKLERVVGKFSENDRTGMVANTLIKIDVEGNAIGRMPEFGQYERGDLQATILSRAGDFAAAPASGLSMRRACGEKVFPIPSPKFSTEADAYLRTVAALFWRVEVIDEPLTSYRLHSSNVTASQKVDAAWCARSIDVVQRIYSVLEEIASKHAWKLAPIEMNSSYSELVLVRDYLSGASRTTLRRDAKNVSVAARNNGAVKRSTTRKAALLGIASRLPTSLGRRVIEQIYLPTRIKRLLATISRLTNGMAFV